MLSIRPSNPQRCIPNLLPARINHNGPINDAERYWKPETDDKGKRHSYFRGRHLHGTALPLPNNYTGAILRVTDQQLPQSQTQPQQPPADEDDEDAETEESIPVEVNIAEQVGEFDQVIVWGHGGEVDGSGDAFIRGMSEWVGFAESMHIDEEEKDKGTKPGGNTV
ncbi:ribonuclease H1 small subunit [Alternaria alternata]|uniref:Ribonuclease H1 small subunit n=2 Tax=Alternaria alternata complex TaxID=187734 RepID=A0A177DER3_ALTAL|nr:ribonuclease H1 small subunit [Alternaria alternata]XP_051589891.1 uncharacterized protein J4E82_003980 [Alternaria postmessia]RII16785.1 hypothetical protein CUC08_Gglean003229 [Alternaria sp. MG1]RYN23710.1 hypothetical protein AA0115_g8605 [Alternaria tenuissima]KAH6862286.1 ribonuclease H2, subunit C [Alternaria alternata]KAI5377188.1 hypothetical protein J4E82_003980 [Alternaria postmessia]OAG17741.1 ribonuclease H1 small subunit [Alternaria alternata]